MKRLFTLLLACCMLCLAGCVNKPSDETSGTDINEIKESLTGKKTGNIIQDPQLAKNFDLVCNQIGIQSDDIADMKKLEDWVGGPSYSFAYGDYLWFAFCGVDDTVESVLIGDSVCVFNKREGSYHIDDYEAEPAVKERAEQLALQALREEFEISDMVDVPLSDWYSDRVLNIYNVVGSVKATDPETQKEQDVPFSFCFEYNERLDDLYLRYFSVGESVLHDSFNDAAQIKPQPVVEQKASVFYEGDGILLIEGELGDYGKEVEYAPGEVYINYHIPAGTYQVTSLVPTCALYVQSNESTTDENSRLVFEKISETVFEGVGDKHEIKVEEGQHIAPSFFAKVVFEPIS